MKKVYIDNKDTFYGYEFYTNYMRSALIGKNGIEIRAKESLEYLKKYPNSGFASSILLRMFADRKNLSEKLLQKIHYTIDSTNGWSKKVLKSNRGLK